MEISEAAENAGWRIVVDVSEDRTPRLTTHIQQAIDEAVAEKDAEIKKLEDRLADLAHEWSLAQSKADDVTNDWLDAKKEIRRLREALNCVVDECDLPREEYTSVEWAAIRKAKQALSGEEE